MRAVAVLAVLLYHAGVPWLPGGYVGVDVFFVISGFLITQHLVGERMRTGRISIAAFYARRIRRLLPAAVLVLLATCVLARLVIPPLGLFDVRRDALATAAYLPNMLFAARGTDYLANDAPSAFQHYWSLALEEQFYLLWPLAILAVCWRSRKPLARIGPLVAATTALSFAACIVLTETHQPWAYFTLPARAWELGVGAAVAVGASRISAVVNPALTAAVAWLGLAGIVAACCLYDSRTSFPGIAAALPVLGAAALIVGGISQPHRCGPEAVLRLRPLQFFGDISYSLYLWHWPLLILPGMYRADGLSPAVRAFLVAVAIVLAYSTRRWLEKPFSAGKREPGRWLMARGGRTYALAAAVTVAALLAGLGTAAHVRLSSDTVAPVWAQGELPQSQTAPQNVPTNLVPSLRAAADSSPAIYADGCHADFFATTPKLCQFGNLASSDVTVLFGDSHAAQWFPALESIAELSGTKLVTLTKSSCPSVDVEVWNSALLREYSECDQWREAAFAMITALAPTTVLIANYQGQTPVSTYGAAKEEAWGDGLARTLARLPQTTRAVVVGDTPNFAVAPSMCLSAHLKDVAACEKPAAAVVNEVRAQTERSTATRLGVAYLDTTQWTCRSGVCSVILGNVGLYRDRHHLTTEFASRLAPALMAAL